MRITNVARALNKIIEMHGWHVRQTSLTICNSDINQLDSVNNDPINHRLISDQLICREAVKLCSTTNSERIFVADFLTKTSSKQCPHIGNGMM